MEALSASTSDDQALVPVFAFQLVALAVEAVEQRADGGMVDRLALVVADQILLADVGDVARLGVFGEQVVERLVLGRDRKSVV